MTRWHRGGAPGVTRSGGEGNHWCHSRPSAPKERTTRVIPGRALRRSAPPCHSRPSARRSAPPCHSRPSAPKEREGKGNHLPRRFLDPLPATRFASRAGGDTGWHRGGAPGVTRSGGEGNHWCHSRPSAPKERTTLSFPAERSEGAHHRVIPGRVPKERTTVSFPAERSEGARGEGKPSSQPSPGPPSRDSLREPRRG